MLRRFQDAGHRPIALAGGATGMIGDPGGRSEERNLLDEDTLVRQRGRHQGADRPDRRLRRGRGGQLVDNRDWTADLTLLDFLRDVGKHVTVNQMLARESVRARLETEHGISYTEFSYMLLQANDYLWLHEHQGCELQIGGSDQWGNILAGVDLIRRRDGAEPSTPSPGRCITAPTARSSARPRAPGCGSTRDRTSPYEFFQHWMHVDDRQVERCSAVHAPAGGRDRRDRGRPRGGPRAAARRSGRLAREVTALVHGAASGGGRGGGVAALSAAGRRAEPPTALDEVAREVPTTDRPRARSPRASTGRGAPPRPALARSKGEARRRLDQGGAYVNGAARRRTDRRLERVDVLHGRASSAPEGQAEPGSHLVVEG